MGNFHRIQWIDDASRSPQTVPYRSLGMEAYLMEADILKST